ncbi:DUF1499 domain-containing protein [Rhodobacter calidifons]
MTGWIVGLLALGAVGGMAYIRLAPSDPARWHVDLAAGGWPSNAHVFCIKPGARYDVQEDPQALLARLDAIALATPRTERLAGSPEEGRITWVTRSALMGFPDYTTAQVMPGPGLCVAGRQRFGSEDLGVNEARIGGWMQELLGLEERPAMTGF